jgi:broad specificity phosphatase PhoE
MNIYFVRHGITAGNEANQFQLPTIPLSERGVEQAAFLAQRFESIETDLIIASPMERARQTAQIIADKIQVPLIESSLFEEIKRPSEVRGRDKKDPEVKEIMRQVKLNFTNTDWRYSDEENFFLAKDRAGQALTEVSARPEANILVVTHGEILRMMLSVLTFGEKLTPEIYEAMKDTFVPFNTGITKINYDSSLGYNDSGWYVHTWNDHAHLGTVN